MKVKYVPEGILILSAAATAKIARLFAPYSNFHDKSSKCPLTRIMLSDIMLLKFNRHEVLYRVKKGLLITWLEGIKIDDERRSEQEHYKQREFVVCITKLIEYVEKFHKIDQLERIQEQFPELPAMIRDNNFDVDTFTDWLKQPA